MGSCFLKLFSKGDQLKIKLTNLKFPKNDNLDLFLLIGGVWSRKRGLAWEQRKQAGNRACEIVGFTWMQFLIPFFWQQKGSKMKGF